MRDWTTPLRIPVQNIVICALRRVAKMDLDGQGDKEKKIPAEQKTGMMKIGELWLADFFYFTRPDASGANMQSYMGPMGTYCLYVLQIRLGHFLCSIVCMTHLIATQLTFSANLTRTCHSDPP